MEKVAFITGGSRGIGQAICETLAEQGYSLAIHCRNYQQEYQQWADELAEHCQVKTSLFYADFKCQLAITDMFDAIDEIFNGRLDVLVNNAGFENCYRAEDMPLKDWDDVIQVNLTAPFQCAQFAANRMKKIGGGSIINITSIHDKTPRKGYAHYCSSKAALSMLTKSTAIEWAEFGIRVNSIGAGAIETDINREAIDEFGRDKFNDWIPAGRVGNVKDIANLVKFLASDDSGYITGTDVYVDGAYRLSTVRYDERTDSI